MLRWIGPYQMSRIRRMAMVFNDTFNDISTSISWRKPEYLEKTTNLSQMHLLVIIHILDKIQNKHAHV